MVQARKAGEGEKQFGRPGDWYCFDDQNVETWDINMLDVECFGGSIKGADSSPKTTSWQARLLLDYIFCPIKNQFCMVKLFRFFTKPADANALCLSF